MNQGHKKILQGLVFLCLLFSVQETFAQCSGVSAAFTVNGTGCGIPRNYTFTNTTTGSYSSSATYIWRSGSTSVDTTTGTGTTPTISINTPGSDTIWMVAIDSNGCRDSVSQIVTTTTSANAVFDPNTGTYNYAPLWQNCILFIASPDSFRIYMQSNGALSNYRVVWGDGGIDSGATLPAFTDLTHNYTTLGTYTVYIISQNGSCTDTVQGRVINERIPTAGIIGPPAGGNVGCAPHTVRFINNSSNVSSSTTFVWSMGDGTTYTLPYTTANDTLYHTYTEGLCNGVVSVQAVNACGSSTATWTPIYINDRDDASWSMTTVNCNPTLPFTFFNNSTNNYCTPSTRLFNWTFGDSTTTGWINTTTPQNHTFPRTGRYTVTLLDSNLCGVDTFRQDVIINFTPDAGFIYTNPNGCGPLSVIITDTTDGLGNVRIWNYGNGTGGSDSTDTVTYTTPGTYNLSLSVVNSCGSDVANLTVNVWAPPTAAFASISNGCSPLTVNFSNTTTYFNDSTITWRWEFGDGTDTAIKDPPSKTYTIPGTYTVWLYAYDTCGSDSVSRTFTVYPKPVADFSADTVCFGTQTHFTNASTVSSGSINQRTWRFGNPSQGSSSSTNPNFTFNSADTFDVRLIVRTNNVCRDTIEKQVIVLANPTTSWAVSPNDTVCIGLAQAFNGTAAANSGTIQSYAWDFDNGTTSTQEDTSLTYPAAGSYSVSFTVTNSFGCVDSSVGNIVVLPLPTIAFTADTACVGSVTTFQDNSSVSPGSIASRRWDLNNDGAFDSTTAITTYIYLSLGSRYVRLEATSDFGCVNLDSNQITVHPLPVPLISVDSSVICMGDSITLSNTSTGAVSYTYDFGDGTTLSTTSAADVRHAYADSGVYTVRIYAYSDRSCTDSNSLTVTVRPTPLAQYTVNQQIACAPFNFVFTNSSLRSTDYTWFSDGNFASTALNRPDSLVSADSQVFRIALVAYNTNYSCPYDTFFLDMGTSRNPIANFVTNPDSGCGPLNVAFGNTSQFASTFYWDFRNGQSSSAQDTSMTFTAASMVDSTYTIKLYAYNWQGCPDSVEKDIVVHPDPDVTFTQTNTDSCGPLTVAFTNTSTHYPGGSIADMSFQWNFGNGTTATSQDSSVQFTASQYNDTTYTVQLIGLSRYGCPDTAISTVRVYPNPVARFTESQADSCGPMTVAFTNTSYPNDTGTIADMTFSWNLGNGVTSTSQNPSTNYGASLIQDSIYTIQLIALSEHGCPDTATNTVRVYPKPTAAFTQSDTSGCGPLTVNFTNTSLPYDTSYIGDMTFSWNFGNGVTSMVQDTSVRFISAASSDTVYTVTLIAFSEHGCADTFTSTVRVHPGPVAQFGVNQAIACAPFNFVFTNNSINSNNFFWAVDGVYGYNQTTRPDTLISLDSQSVLISLVAETSFGCPNDTTSMVIGTSRNPIANFVTNPDSGCGPLNVAFGNTSQFASTFYWDFRNGQSSSAQDTSMTFAAASMVDSTYTIKLYAYNWQGCPDSIEKNIVVHPDPEVTFTQTNTDSCGPLTVAFTNTSTHYPGGSIADMSFQWNFGNGNTATSQDSSVRFTASQYTDTTYTVQLIGLSRYGCPDTATSTVRVYPNPVARFTESQADSCGPMTVAFTNTSYPNDTGTIADMTFSWNLGNGVTSTSQNTSTNYGASLIQDSIYTIQLIALSEHGCPDTATNTVRVYPKPTAAFTQSDTSGCGPLTVNFTNTSLPYDTSDIGDMTFSWNFGNGQTRITQDASISFLAAAINDTVYTVTLIAFSEHGCADTTISTVRVHPKPSVALAKDDSTGCDPVIVNFTGTGVNVATYHWYFTTDDSSTVQNPTFSFRAVPFDDTTYLVKLAGESPYGCVSDTVTTTVNVLGGPYAEFHPSPDSVCATTASQMINNSLGATSYYWDFGNGDTSSVVSPQAVFSLNPAADTAYHIVMVASSGNGCRDTADAYVVVSPVPTASFIVDIDTGCSPLAVQFTDQSVFASNYAWSYSNGQADTAVNPTFTFRNSGTVDSVFTARLIVTNLGGCTDTATDFIRVYPDPGADFVITPSSGCGDLSVSFGNQSTPNDTGSISIMSFSWDLGNGVTSTATNPSSSYVRSLVQDSVYTVRLIGTSEHGCLDTIQKNVRVFPKPLAQFTQSDTSGCGPLSVSFFNTSIPYDTGSIADMNFQWNFGNGFTSYDRHDTVIFYPAAVNDTVYTIRLIAFSEHGCRDTFYSTVRVHPKPSALFSRTPAAGCGPLSVDFTGSGINVASYQWNFGNGNTGSGSAPNQVYYNPSDADSIYIITLSTTSIYGCVSDSIQRTVTVRPDPAAGFTQSDDSICGTSTVVFSNSSTGANSYAWNFGDGSTATNTNPQHSFAMNPTADTTYTVRLIATNFFNCRDTTFGTVTIFPFPTSIITTDTSMGCTPLTVNFGHSSLLSTGFTWNFGNGSTSTSQTPTSIFTNTTLYDTIYSVKLSVSSVHGCLDSSTSNIRVFPPPTVDFVAQPTAGCGDLTINFDNQSIPNDTGSIAIMTFNWDLGNGNTAITEDASSLYVRSLIQDSLYTVTLIGTSEHGCLDTSIKTVRTYPKPLANFTQSDTAGCGPLTVNFTNISVPYDTGSIANMTFIWNFGNGLSSSSQNGSSTFSPSLTQDTVYTIRLIAISEHGCRDTMTSTITIHPDPNFSYTQTPSNGCSPLAVNFDASGINVQTWYWDFANGDTSSQEDPTEVFLGRPDFDTTYAVQLWAVSSYGCWSDTQTSNVIVRLIPEANFVQSNDSLCGTSTITFTNQSTGANSYAWNFGDGSTSGTANPQHSFAMNPTADTTYTVRLIATNFFNCRDTTFGTVTIFPFPTSIITTDTSMGCTPLTVNFGHSSLLSTGFTWNFGNGSTSTSQTPTSIFTNTTLYDTIYSVKLRVSSVHGCLDSSTSNIRVFPPPTVDFVAQPTAGCGDLTINFDNQSIPNDTGSIAIMSFNWDLGNGNTATTEDVSSLYVRSLIQDSLYTVILIGTSEHGCLDTSIKTVRTYPKPLANFTQSDTAGCGPLTVNFTNISVPYDTSSIANMTFIWNFGNGLTSTSQNGSSTFSPSLTQDTVYTIRLIAISEHGCRDTMTSTITIHPDPNFSYTQTPSNGCSPLAVNFDATGINVQTWYWDFANGDTSSQEDPTEVFLGRPDFDTTYAVQLWAVSSYGCWSDTQTSNVIVRLIPEANFVQSNDSLCGTSTITFTNQSTGANSYAWNFGDGSTSGTANPQHSFAMNPTADTTYTVRLIATNFFNCRDTTFGTVTIFPFPTSIITTDTSMGCTPLTVNFGHSSLLSTGFTWNFGNGSTSTSQTPTSIFTNTTLYDTIYSVKLSVSSVHGCLDSSTSNIRVFPPPTVDFVAQPTAGCGDLTINFDNQSIPNDTGSIAIMSFNWDLGNGNTAITEDASSLYVRSLIQDSLYTVTLIGTSEHGCLDTSIKTVRTYPKPLANYIQSDTSGCSPLVVNFTNLSLPYDTSTISDMSFQWDFGNGLTSTAINPVPTFYASQTQDTVFTIRLITFSEHGCSDTAYSTVRVNPNPTLSFTSNLQSGCGPLEVQFTGNVLNAETHYWDFGDGDTSSLANPGHFFQNRPDLDTSYTVRYWAESQHGCWSDTITTTIIVRPDPVANFSQNLDSLCGGGTIQFSNNSTLGYTYVWSFRDGSASTTAVNPQHVFTETAFTDTGYLVQLIATSVYGCRDTLIKPTTIFPLPDAQITFSPDSGCSPLLVQFGNTSIIAASHSWSFGDNTTATGDTLSHLFVNQLGINQDFQVIQEAITTHGCIDRDTVTIRVHPLPRPNFVFSKTGICDTSEYNFSNVSAGALLYEWDFGDGTGSFMDDPSHIFPNALNNDTTFITKLTATTNYGCVDSVSKVVTVTPILIAQAATAGAMGCPPLAVDFVNNSRNATNFYWDFNDGFVSTASSPSHTFINPNLTTSVYNVQLIVSNAFGCADTAIVPVTVLPNINAAFIPSKSAACDVAEYTFTNISLGSVNYQWDFGDGTTSTQFSPIHIFPTSLSQDTTFIVRLISGSLYGCYDTSFRSITVHPIVTALFTVDNNESCGFMLAQFTNLSTNGNYHVWDFGDGTGSAQFSPSHPYNQVGTYYPSIEVYDAYGCSASYTLPNPIIIWEIPQANFVALPTTQRLPNSTFNFTNLSIAIDPLTYEWNFGEPISGANNSSTLQDPQHTYADSGSYVVQLIVDNGHCRDTIVRTIRVEYYFPIASFRQNPDTGCMEHTVEFFNESQYATSYRWFFGDGGQSTEENPTHTYINPGVYTVTLIAYGPGGVDDSTKIDQIVVIQKPYANFYTTPTVAWLPNTQIQFVNISLLATSYVWDIFAPSGPDIRSIEEAPIIELTEEGEYTIRLIAVNDYGCRDTAYKENYIRINADGALLVPDAFTPNGDGVNDSFRPVFEGVERDSYTFRVYNRWGELIFQTHDIDEAWDGTFQGVMSESEVYVWQVQGRYYGTDHFEKRGRVLLIK